MLALAPLFLMLGLAAAQDAAAPTPAGQTPASTTVIIRTMTTYDGILSDRPASETAYLDARAAFWRAERAAQRLTYAGSLFFPLVFLLLVCLLLPVLALYERDTRRMERVLAARRAAARMHAAEAPPYRSRGRWPLLAWLPFLRRTAAQGATGPASRPTAVCYDGPELASPPPGFTRRPVPCAPSTVLYVSASAPTAVPTWLPAATARQRAEVTKWTVAFAVTTPLLALLLGGWAINIRRRRRTLRLLLGDDAAWFSPQNKRVVGGLQDLPTAVPV
ncbi:hypothetical protein Q8F55_006824 [Vanrija albida]|uniref:Uncharacterized protein n=1 Tax=Vanrija albida TaxID=181172 RepID=A0ABR3PYZ5_9TREE